MFDSIKLFRVEEILECKESNIFETFKVKRLKANNTTSDTLSQVMRIAQGQDKESLFFKEVDGV